MRRSEGKIEWQCLQAGLKEHVEVLEYLGADDEGPPMVLCLNVSGRGKDPDEMWIVNCGYCLSRQ